MDISIQVSGKTVAVQSPYNPDFVARAKKIGGKWTKPVWVFPASQEERVRQLCKDVYGVSSDDAGDQVTVRVLVRPGSSRDCCLRVGPLQVFRAFDRDSGGKLCDGIILVHGTVNSGGSRKNPDARWSHLILEAEVPAGAVDLITADADVLSCAVIPAGETAEETQAAVAVLQAQIAERVAVKAAEAAAAEASRRIQEAADRAEQIEARQPGCVEAEWARAVVVLVAEGADINGWQVGSQIEEAQRERLREEARIADLDRARTMPLDALAAELAGQSAWFFSTSYYSQDAFRAILDARKVTEGDPAAIRAARLQEALKALAGEFGAEAVKVAAAVLS